MFDVCEVIRFMYKFKKEKKTASNVCVGIRYMYVHRCGICGVV